MCQDAVGLRDGGTVGIAVWVPQELGQALGERVGDDVLEAFGLLVDLLPRITEVL